jgi:hypothetical protein
VNAVVERLSADEAIELSVRENRIVTISDVDGEEEKELSLLADGNADHETLHEYWGTTNDDAWCVHVAVKS